MTTSTLSSEVERYRLMALIRGVEERIQVLYTQGMVQGPAHLAIGHEAIAVGAASVLEADDCSIGTYRGHGHVLARGVAPEALVAEMLGKATGMCGGKGGSMHLTSVEHGYYGSYAIVGAQLPIAVGLAWACRLRGSTQVVVCFFGDGATNIGAFHEALNLAAVWRLPVVFVCENNQYMEYTRIADVTPVRRPAADRAAAYGLEPIVVDGNDVEAVAEVMGAAVARARGGDGPSLVEAETYRICGHSAADPQAYRSVEEVDRWRKRDPLTCYRDVLIGRGLPPDRIAAVDDEVAEVVRRAVQAAKDALAPQLSTASSQVWASEETSWRN